MLPIVHKGPGDVDWPQNGRGLYVPASYVRPSADPTRVTGQRSATQAAWTQAVGALLAMVIAVPAVFISLETYQDQQQINVSQARINTLAQERYERRYASRVSWWETNDIKAPITGGGGLAWVPRTSVWIQNRAIVPVRGHLIVDRSRFVITGPNEPPTYISGGTQKLILDIGTLPPCTTATVTFPVVARLIDEATEEGSVWRVDTLRFTDGLNFWLQNGYSLKSWDGYAGDGIPAYARNGLEGQQIGGLDWSNADASDCGESG